MYMLCCLIQGQTLLESDVWMINTIINRNCYAMGLYVTGFYHNLSPVSIQSF